MPRRFSGEIVDGVSHWIMHSNRNSVRKIISRLRAVCRHYGLVMARSDEMAKLAAIIS